MANWEEMTSAVPIDELASVWLGCAGDSETSRQWWDALRSAYSSPDRHYHTLEHVRVVLSVLRWIQPRQRRGATERRALDLATWFHDAVYDTRRSDNEERSGALARQAMTALRVAPATIERVVELILSTRTHRSTDPLASPLLDADLAILGAPAAIYDAYASAIRREFAWVADDAFRGGRAAVLRRFLDRPRIFLTAPCRGALEEQARDNLSRELEGLESAKPG